MLFIHENFPAQFGALADTLAKRGWSVVFATQKESVSPKKVHKLSSGVKVVRYERARAPSDNLHPYLRVSESAVLNGQGFARLGLELSKNGFTPDVIMAHSGWGSGSFAKVVWPNAKLIQYLEWWYNFPPPDVNEAEEAKRSKPDWHARTLSRNLPFFLDFQQADLVITPTNFQASQAPDFVQQKLIIQHDGIDCDFFCPSEPGEERFAWDGLPDDAPIVTFATRGMEPMRGFPTFMAAAAQMQKERPDIHIVIAGNPKAHYGPEPATHENWKAKCLSEFSFDEARLHFTGPLPKDRYTQLLRRSDAHVYLTRPFVLSWSLLEAMASATPIVASDVPPVREVANPNEHIRVVPPDEVGALCREIHWLLDHPKQAREMGQRARNEVTAHYDAKAAHDVFEHLMRSQLEDLSAFRNAIMEG
ncbi:MAG: glycosyltransferase [Litoreibacter sp.]|nr:glycosyltransferase [Litoreibacter sp.]